MFLDAEVLNDIASELAVDVAFIEKDWYASQALNAIASIENEDFIVMFSGGTSLTKAHGLIQRFSEDLDFRCQYAQEMSGNQKKNARRRLKEQVVYAIKNLGIFEIDKPTPASNYIKFHLLYKSMFGQHQALRPHLEIEFSFTQPQLMPVVKDVTSFVGRFIGKESEASIACLSPVEIAADKLSALSWRIIKRDRSSEKDDPTLVRHLHDLSALYDHIASDMERFELLFKQSYEVDQLSKGRITGLSPFDAVDCMVEILKADALYEVEYERFVASMSYAADEDQISFSQAIKCLVQLNKLRGSKS